MRLALSDEQRMIERLARRLTADGPVRLDRLAEAGLLALGSGPEGDDWVSLALVASALGEVAGAGSFVVATAAAAIPVARYGTEPQRTEWLPHLQAGTRRLALAAGLTAGLDGDHIVLSGTAPLVREGGAADGFLILARDAVSGRFAMLVAAHDAPGLDVRAVVSVDGASAADLSCEAVRLPREALLGGWLQDGDAIEAVEDGICLLDCAAAAGAVAALSRITIEHCRTRVQFGRPLADFQTIEHRLARLAVLAQEAAASAAFAAVEMGEGGDRSRRAVSSARVRIAAIAEHVAQEAVQLHGAMGLSDELAVSPLFRALFAFTRRHGGTEAHRERLAALLLDGDRAAVALAGEAADGEGEGLTLNLGSEELAFRDEARAFLSSALTPELRRGGRLTIGIFAEPDIERPWHRKLYEQGWIAPGWPLEEGGAGWDDRSLYLYDAEYHRFGAPSLQQQGLRMLGPVLMRYATPEQKARFLPGILSGETCWCQGYSEPGAGSDLAALRTGAQRDGDEYVVNGSKLWTTQAQHADWMFALVRTSDEGRRQDGISFLLIDMKSPGITVRPIRILSGEHEVNEVFFEDVRVPVANRLGEENQGWECAKYLLAFERGGGFVSGALRAYLARAVALLRRRAAIPASLRHELAEVGAAVDAIEMGELLRIDRPGEGLPAAVIPSAGKLRLAEVRQRIGALACAALGEEALRWTAERPLYHAPERGLDEELSIAAVPLYFNDLAYSIFAGSSEIQLSIIGRAVIAAAG